MSAKIKIEPIGFVQSHKQGTLINLKKSDIDRILGFTNNDDGDGYKVKYTWDFSADGVECSIWDWKGSDRLGQWSFYGPREVFCKIFGNEHIAVGLYA